MPESAQTRFENPVTARIVAFIREIGIPVVGGTLAEPGFLPGIKLDGGRMLVDESQLAHPGDLLHEAGHLAVMTAERRGRSGSDASKKLGDEIGAILWSYAALVHLRLDPAIVFHPAGYRGASDYFIQTFTGGTYIGLPLLQWMGMTFDPANAAAQGVAPFPYMVRWLRA